jgi:2'-5' RNA ligase
VIIRCFAALPVPAEASGELEHALAPFRERGLPVRWVRREGVHITLKFFGEIARDRLDAIAEALSFAVEGTSPFGATLSGLGAFPDATRARVLWAGIEAPQVLELLQDRIERRTEALGFPIEGTIYRPHITVARVREGERLPAADMEAFCGTVISTSFLVDKVVLYQSVPGPGGSVYTTVHEAPLRG